MTSSEAVEIMAYVATAYPAITWSQAVLSTWCSRIVEFEFARGMAGARRYCDTCAAFPSIAGLRAAILHRELPPLDEILADAQRVFTVTFCGLDALHPITQRAVAAAGGIDRLRHGTIEYMQRDLERAVRTAYEGASTEVVATGVALPSRVEAITLLGNLMSTCSGTSNAAVPEATQAAVASIARDTTQAVDYARFCKVSKAFTG